jgi:hypothetical protein
MFYSAWQANELKKQYEKCHEFKYDVVVKTRLDLRYENPVILKDIKNEDDKILYVSERHNKANIGHNYPSEQGEYEPSSDTLVYGKSLEMDDLAEIYPDFISNHKSIHPFQYGECYIGFQAKKCGINIQMQEMNYTIYRG